MFMKKALRVIFRTCACGGSVRAVVIYELDRRGVRVGNKREVGWGCDSCYNCKLIETQDVWPDEAPQEMLF
jgi:hypothetical protein